MKHVIKQIRLLMRVGWDFIRGMWTLPAINSCVTVFGSARLGESHEEYWAARKLGHALAARGITIMTGGGTGLMEAVSRGAREGGGRILGCRIRLSPEQRSGAQLDRAATFRYFFVRKVMMVRHACGFVVLPGGLGTLDESFEVLTLIQMKKLHEHPIVFLGTHYWKPLLELIQCMGKCGTIRSEEMAVIMRLVLFTDDINLAIAHIEGRERSMTVEVRSIPQHTAQVSTTVIP
jgi:uncharacterized protein (TIGR00730 family)